MNRKVRVRDSENTGKILMGKSDFLRSCMELVVFFPCMTGNHAGIRREEFSHDKRRM